MNEPLNSLSDLGNTLSPSTPVAEVAAPPVEPKIDSLGRAYATGKRKSAVSRVWVKPGSGKIEIKWSRYCHLFWSSRFTNDCSPSL